MPILRINEFPENSGSLTNDDVFLFMDDPAGGGVTKYIPLSELGSVISGGTTSSSIVTTCHNKTGSTIAKMTVVYIDGGHGNLPTIAKAQANSESGSSKTYGITSEEITDDHSGKVVVLGALTGLDTNQFSVSQGTVLYLSPTVAGGLTTTKPSAPNHIVTVGKIVRNHNNQGVIEVNIQNGFEIQELHNVAISGVANNDILVYNSGTSLWENKNTNIFSNTSGITGASSITNIVSISQINYDALVTKDSNTLYVIS